MHQLTGKCFAPRPRQRGPITSRERRQARAKKEPKLLGLVKISTRIDPNYEFVCKNPMKIDTNMNSYVQIRKFIFQKSQKPYLPIRMIFSRALPNSYLEFVCAPPHPPLTLQAIRHPFENSFKVLKGTLHGWPRFFSDYICDHFWLVIRHFGELCRI